MAQLFISCSSLTIAVTLSARSLISAKNEFLIVDASHAMKALTVVFNYLNDHLTHSIPAFRAGNSSLSCKRWRLEGERFGYQVNTDKLDKQTVRLSDHRKGPSTPARPTL